MHALRPHGGQDRPYYTGGPRERRTGPGCRRTVAPGTGCVDDHAKGLYLGVAVSEVSVIVAAHNQAAWLGEAIESVRA